MPGCTPRGKLPQIFSGPATEAPPIAGLVMSISRQLQPEDMATLELSPVKLPSLKRLRDSHHALARVLAAGLSNVDASRITGFESTFISSLKADPTFQELLAFYAEHNEVEQANLRDRMTLIALDVSAEIRERLHSDPDSFSHSEMRQLLTNLADRVGHGPSSTVHQTVDVTENLSYEDQKILAAALKEIQDAAVRGPGVTIEAEPGEAGGPSGEARGFSRAAEDIQPVPERGPAAP